MLLLDPRLGAPVAHLCRRGVIHARTGVARAPMARRGVGPMMLLHMRYGDVGLGGLAT